MPVSQPDTAEVNPGDYGSVRTAFRSVRRNRLRAVRKYVL